MTLIKSGTLRVSGANLYYEVRGSGPMLLMIAGGGGGGAGDWNGFVNHLTHAYTVVTYDRRGALRSTLDDPHAKVTIEDHGDDAHRLLAALATGPAYVFGSSAGALIGLDLVARHPEQVRTLVAHEPPAHYLLPGADQPQLDPLETYRRKDGLAALKEYGKRMGLQYQEREPGLELPEQSAAGAANADALFKYTFQAVRRYRLDIAALGDAPTLIVVAGGAAGREGLGYRCAAALADRLGITLVEFPSHHVGYLTHPRAFAARLQDVLSNTKGT